MLSGIQWKWENQESTNHDISVKILKNKSRKKERVREESKLIIPYYLQEVLLIKESKTPVIYKSSKKITVFCPFLCLFLLSFFFFPKKQLNINYIQRRDCSDNIVKKREVSYCFFAKGFQPTL